MPVPVIGKKPVGKAMAEDRRTSRRRRSRLGPRLAGRAQHRRPDPAHADHRSRSSQRAGGARRRGPDPRTLQGPRHGSWFASAAIRSGPFRFGAGRHSRSSPTNFVVPRRSSDTEKIEFLGDGQQFVAHGIHPDTQGGIRLDRRRPDHGRRRRPSRDLGRRGAGAPGRPRRDAGRGFRLSVASSQGNGGSVATARQAGAQEHGPRRGLGPNGARRGMRRSSPTPRTATATSSSTCSAYNVFQIVWGNPGLLDEEEVRAAPLRGRSRPAAYVDDDGEDAVWQTIESAAEAARSQPRVRPVPTLHGSDSERRPGRRWRRPGARDGEREASGPGRREPGAGCTAGPRRLPPAPGIRAGHPADRGRAPSTSSTGRGSALIAAGGFDLYQRDAVMVRPVMQRLPAAGWHGTKRTTMVWRLMRVEAALPDRDARPGGALPEATTAGAGIGSTRLPAGHLPRPCSPRDGAWKLPVVLGIVHTPQLRADGSLLTTPGYDPETRLLFKPDGEVFPDIPERPTKDDAEAALETDQGGRSHLPLHGRGRPLGGPVAAS